MNVMQRGIRCASLDAGRHTEHHGGRRTRSAGTVLIVTIWVVLVLAGLALVFGRSMRVAGLTAANHVSLQQAETVADGALAYVIAQIQADEESATLESASPYEAMPVGSGYFWVLRSNLEDNRSHDFGPTDEAGKVNLNSATLEMLLKLPGMTAELAASIIDWRDADDEITAGGAESEYYLLLSEPYTCKNGPLETVEEVLLIKGASTDLLFGEDTNLNGVLDDNENDADQSEPADNRNGRLDAGFYDYVTVYSAEANVDSEGRERLNVSDLRNNELTSLLREAVGDDQYFQMMDRLRASRPFANVLDFYVKSGMKAEQFAPIADRLTTVESDTLVGLVNVNKAPREVLLCLPELEESDVESLLARRESADADLESIAWVADVLDAEKAAAVGGHITTRSFQYSADLVGLAGDGRAYKRYKAVIDTRERTARVVYFRPLTSLGWPLDPKIVRTLRKGEPLTDAVLGMH